MSKLFLAVVGVLYVALGVWCALLPESTSRAVGYALAPGSGQSEFLAVYGGLEVGLGVLFLVPLRRADVVRPVLLACALVHGGIVAFRTIGFLTLHGIAPMTYGFAALEWAILIGAVLLARRRD